MTEDQEWRTREQMMAHLSRSERTLQVMVRDGRLERRVGEDKRAYYRVAQRLAAPQRDAADRVAELPPPWAVELLEEIRALRAENAAHRASQDAQRALSYTERNADPPVAQQAERGPFNPEVPDSSSGRGRSAETPPPAEGRSATQRRSDPQRPWWKRLLSIK